MYLGRPGKQIVKQTLHYWIENRKQIGSNTSVTNRYRRGGGRLGGIRKSKFAAHKKRIGICIQSYLNA